jgi:putative intracellular protease/amidase
MSPILCDSRIHRRRHLSRFSGALSLFVALWMSLVAFAEPVPRDSMIPAGMVGQSAAWATPWFVVPGDGAGPTVMVIGGMHGNEPAGSVAAKQLLHWPIRRGKLIIVPEVNRLGLAADMRWFPPDRNSSSLRDLNRQFPAREDERPSSELAAEIWSLVQQHAPDYVLDLHEGFDFHVTNEKSVGSSVIYARSEHRDAIAKTLLSAVNQTVFEEGRRFVPIAKSGAAPGSLVRACTERLGIDAFILETTFKDQPLSLRTRQHRLLVSTFLHHISMVDEECVDVLTAQARGERIRVALYDDAGAASNGLSNLAKAIHAAEDITFAHVGRAEMRAKVLGQFDVVLFPGGSGRKQGQAIGETGRESVREFARAGGGIVGVCAGAYLCSAHYDWSLHVINTAIFNKTVEIPGVGRKSMWYRGDGQNVRIEFSDEARDLFAREGPFAVRYHNGPIVSRGKAANLPEPTTLAWFRSEVVHYEPQRGTMIDTPAILSAPYGAGRILSISPHPEATPGLESLIAAAVRWTAGVEEAVSK